MAERPPITKPVVLQKPPNYRAPGVLPPPGATRLPPRKQQLLPTVRPYKAKRYTGGGSRRPCYGWLCCCCCLLVLLISLAIAGALSYLWFHPKLPIFHLQSIQTQEFHLAVKPDGTYLNAVTIVRVQATNPNAKIGLLYSQSQARMSVPDDDGEVDLGAGLFPAFVQGKRNSTMMKFAGKVNGVMVDDGVSSRLRARFRSKSLRFVVEVRVGLGIRFVSKRSRTLPVRVFCGEISQEELEGGTLPRCTLGFSFLQW